MDPVDNKENLNPLSASLFSNDSLDATYATSKPALMEAESPDNSAYNRHESQESNSGNDKATNLDAELLISTEPSPADERRSSSGRGQNLPTAAAASDLCDFELPPISGSSSSGSEPPAPSRESPTIRRRKSSGQQQQQQQQQTQAHQSASSSAAGAAPDLNAIVDMLVASYSSVSHLVHWRRPIESGIVFGTGLTLIAALTFFSIISVFAYTALGIIFASGTLRLYKTIMSTLGKPTETPIDHMWNKVHALNVTMSPDKMHSLVDSSLGSLNASLVYFKQVLLAEDKFATLKFGAFLYTLTYIGAWFNGMTLITITYLALFSAPVFYEQNKTKIDEGFALANNQISGVVSTVTDKISSLIGGNSRTSQTRATKRD